MKNLLLYVPTCRRIPYQFTLHSLPRAWRERTILVCPKDEVKEHSGTWKHLHSIVSPATANIADTRAWIFKNALSEKILVADDDLLFSHRAQTCGTLGGFWSQAPNEKWEKYKTIHPNAAKLDNLNPDDPRLDLMFKKIENVLDMYRHVGISERYFNNTRGHEWSLNCKVLHALAYHVPTVLEHCDIGWTKWHEDVDYTIQLLLAGFQNARYEWGAVNEARGWNASGGCSSYRKFAEQKPCAIQMARRYPGIVSPYEKLSKAGPMWVVRVNWKRAIQQGIPQHAREFL
jgi:hypothetical protein